MEMGIRQVNGEFCLSIQWILRMERGSQICHWVISYGLSPLVPVSLHPLTIPEDADASGPPNVGRNLLVNTLPLG